jgi:hypothetical protein
MNPEFQLAVDKFDLVGWTENYAPIRSETEKYARFDCPFCDGRRTLNVGKRVKVVRCFRCEGVGHSDWEGRANIVDWIMLLKGGTKFDAVKTILQDAGLTVRRDFVPENRNYEIPKDALPIAASCAEDHPCRLYLKRRHVGHLANKFYVCVSGKFTGRIIMPINWMGKYLGYDAKTYFNQSPKSLVFCPGDSIYSSYTWNKTLGFAVMTESVLDAETVGVNSCGLLGSDVGEDRFPHLLELRKHGIHTLVWFLDADALSKQWKIIFRWTSIYFQNKAVRAPVGEDPNSLGPSRCWDLINSAKLIESEYDLCV